MVYKIVKTLFNIDSSRSIAISLWVDCQTNQYFVSHDGMRDITPVTNNQYMLLYEEPKVTYSPYRDVLTNPKLVSYEEFITGYIKYDNSVWRLRGVI